MERGFGSGSGRINHENEGGIVSELFNGTIGGYASGSGNSGVGKKHFQNCISLCFNFFFSKITTIQIKEISLFYLQGGQSHTV